MNKCMLMYVCSATSKDQCSYRTENCSYEKDNIFCMNPEARQEQTNKFFKKLLLQSADTESLVADIRLLKENK